MESLKEKFNITKNSLFDWNIIEKKTKIDEAPKDTTDLVSTTNHTTNKSNKLEQENLDSIIKIEITDINDIKQDIHKIIEIKNDTTLKDTTRPDTITESESIYNKVDLHNIDELNSNLNNLIDKISKMTSTIEMLENKINNLEELSKTNNYNQLLSSPYLGGLGYPFYNFYLHNYKFDDNVDKNTASIE
jgi:hypothetical protein